MKILVLLNNSYVTDSRVQRTIKTLSTIKNSKVVLLCVHRNEPKLKKIEIINNLTVIRKLIMRFNIGKKKNQNRLFISNKISLMILKSIKKKRFIKKIFWLIESMSLIRILQMRLIKNIFWFFETEFYNKLFYIDGVKFNPDIIHCNDLSTLLAGYKISKKCSSKLIYDSHELELDRNSSFNKITKYKRYLTEKLLINKCNHVITVSESIANYLMEFYKIPKPSVIYNSPEVNKSNKNFKIEDHILDWKFYKKKKIIIYIGLVTYNRGIEQLLESYEYLNNSYCIFLLGPVNKNFIELISKKYPSSFGDKGILFIPPIKKELITKFVSYADVSILPIQNTCKSYNFCFPNKLLESVYSNVPVAVSNLVELSTFVKRYQCGLIFNQKDPFDIAQKIKLLANNKNKYKINKVMKKEIDEIYSEKSQNKSLLEIYKSI
jgi:glycosyltransferase involved in cell wall biosynthesis